MKYFSDSVINPYIRRAGYRRLCEVGASFGEHTARLLEVDGVSLVVVDPCIDLDLTRLNGDRVSVRRGLSLEVLPTLGERFDCILVDGDHNWYTVYHELKAIDESDLLRPGGTIFLHDVGWPYGRRDMYYQPETVPAPFVQPHAMKGMVPGRSELVESGGSNAGLYNAVHEGGPRNGVLTAVEDFVRERPGKYRLLVLTDQHGLGILQRRGGVGDALPWLRVWAAQAANRWGGRVRRVLGRS